MPDLLDLISGHISAARFQLDSKELSSTMLASIYRCQLRRANDHRLPRVAGRADT